MWNTTIRGKNLTKRKMTDEEQKMYGLPLTGRAKVEAEMESLNFQRISEPERDCEEWELEATPNRAELS